MDHFTSPSPEALLLIGEPFLESYKLHLAGYLELVLIKKD
jgi:hypothetical protein